MILRVDVEFRAARRDAESFDNFLDAVADEYHAIRDEELDYTASLANYTASFTIPLPGLTLDAFMKALADLRTAIHAAGGGTPGWPTSHAILGSRVEPCPVG